MYSAVFRPKGAPGNGIFGRRDRRPKIGLERPITSTETERRLLNGEYPRRNGLFGVGVEVSGLQSDLVDKAVILTDGKAGTVEGVWLDELHGLRISIRGHDGKWPVSTVKFVQTTG
jgi:hypothetical protein